MEGIEPHPESSTTMNPPATIAPRSSNVTWAEGLERVLLTGDLSVLSPEQAVAYYARVCESLGLNPLTQPFEYLNLNGKMILYARRACTNQLRQIHQVSIRITAREVVGDILNVTAQATLPSGRCDESVGSVNVSGLKGEALSNAWMRAETKAKRRVTLDICGLATLDESELEGVADRARSARFKAPSPEAFPLASAPAEPPTAVPAQEAPQEAAWEPAEPEERSGVVVPFKAPQDAVARTAVELFGPKLRALRTADQLIDWMRQVIAHGFEPVAKRALFALWEKHVRAMLPGTDPTVLLAQAKNGGAK